MSKKTSIVKDDSSSLDLLHSLVREAFDPEKPTKLDLLMVTLASTETSDEHMTRILQLLVTDNVAMAMRRRCDQKRVLDLLVKSSWSMRGSSVITAFVDFTLDVLISNLWAAKNFLQVVVQLFVVSKKDVGDPTADDVDEELQRRRRHDLLFENAHCVIGAVTQRIPGVRHHLLAVLEKSFPFKKTPTYVQECFVLNLLRVCDHHPDLRPPLLMLLFQRLTALDVLASRQDIMEKEDDASLSSKGISPVVDFNASSSSSSSSSTDEFYLLSSRLSLCFGTRTVHEVARTLDRLLLIVFQWLSREWRLSRGRKARGGESSNNSLSVSSSFSSPSSSTDSFQALWRTLLSVFQQTVLTSESTTHSQFILFYVSSLSPALTDAFVDFLWKRARDFNQAPVIRRAAACYIASFAARANFLKEVTLKTIFENMLAWAARYCEKAESGTSSFTRSTSTIISNTTQSRNRHSTFFIVVQAMFYIVIFRHRILFDNSQRALGLKLKRLVDSPLNPLQFCVPDIADRFAVVCSSYALIDCFPIINANRRSAVPLADSHQGDSVFATFFPFDPYLLVQSGVYITMNGSFLDYEGFSVGADSPAVVSVNSSHAIESMDFSDSTEMEDSMFQGESKTEKRQRIDSISFDNDDEFCCLDLMFLE